MTRRYFISHAYADQPALARLLATRLPDKAEPFIFPPIKVSPDERVSDDLVQAVAACDGLIYLQDDASQRSFWVGFERNLALRLGKPVFAFSAQTGRLVRDEGAAIDPVIACAWNAYIDEDTRMTWQIAMYLGKTRNFDIGRYRTIYSDDPKYFRQFIDDEFDLKSKLARGGSVLLLLSNDGLTSEYFDYHPKTDDPVPTWGTAQKFAIFPLDRTVFAWLSPPDRPAIEAAIARMARFEHWAAYLDVIRVALAEPTPLVLAFASKPDWNRVDDLMVRLTYSAFKAGMAQ